MKEQFCTYKISKTLKELGFDKECFAYYDAEEDFHLCDGIKMIKYAYKYHKEDESVLAPLWQQAIDWFITEKNILPYVEHSSGIWTGVVESSKGYLEKDFDEETLARNLSKKECYYKAREWTIKKAIELCQKEK